jgi:hypothetical protein
MDQGRRQRCRECDVGSQAVKQGGGQYIRRRAGIDESGHSVV